jgi:hypothetical protein
MKYGIFIYALFFMMTVPCQPSDSHAFIADDYPVTNDMLDEFYGHPIQCRGAASFDKAWFVNDTISQALVIELYTDYHRLQLIHFNIIQIPNIVFRSLELHSKADNQTTYVFLNEKSKPDAVRCLIKAAKRISPNYFKTNKGFSLGMSSKNAVKFYGAPSTMQETNEGTLYSWDFLGDDMGYANKSDLPANYVVNSFGYHVKILFKNNKAVVIIMENDAP